MTNTKRQRDPVTVYGLYIAVALLAYGILGAFLNDIYFPGKRTRGVHFHYETLPPVLLCICFVALQLVLEDFKEYPWTRFVRVGLKAGVIVSLGYAFFLMINPPGRRTVSAAECQTAYARIARFAQDSGGDDSARAFFHGLAEQCEESPMLKTFHSCVMKARVGPDINGCSDEARRLYEQKNATQ